MSSKTQIRLIFLISTPKLAEKAETTLKTKGVVIHYLINAKGTATSEIMDTLGLGNIDKNVLVGVVPKNAVEVLFEDLSAVLSIGNVNSGIAFTMPMSGASNIVVKMVETALNERFQNLDAEDENNMSDIKYTMIAAVVNRGYSGNVMEAAKAAGASGGTVINSHRNADEDAERHFGLSLQEEKEIVLIVAKNENKLDIMKKISESCGMNSEAKGVVMSFPIEDVIGLKRKIETVE